MIIVAGVAAAAFAGGCAGDPLPDAAAVTSQGLTAGTCTGPLPQTKGTADIFSGFGYTGLCIRIHGDVLPGVMGQAPGGLFTPGWMIQSSRLSGVNTWVTACKGPANAAGCTLDQKIAGTSGTAPRQLPGLPWPAPSVFVGFNPPPLCPYVTGPYAPPFSCTQCGTTSDSNLPNVVCHANATTDPIVGDIHDPDNTPCICPAGGPLTVASQCNGHCP